MSDPYIPFYPADYLGDTMHLSLEEHGAYFKLMMCMWRSDGWLDDDVKKICLMLGITPKKWATIRPSLTNFFTYAEGRFSQKRLLAELQATQKKRINLSDNGRKGGRPKVPKNNNSPKADEKADEKQSESIARVPSEPEPIKKDSEGKEPSAEETPELPLIDFKKTIFDQGLTFLSQRTNKTQANLRPLLAKWCKLYGDEKTASAIMAAQKFSPVEPISYIEKYFQENRNATPAQRKSTIEILREGTERARASRQQYGAEPLG